MPGGVSKFNPLANFQFTCYSKSHPSYPTTVTDIRLADSEKAVWLSGPLPTPQGPDGGQCG